MPLIDLWQSAPKTVTQFTIQQVVSSAGDGKLRDGSLCSTEFRDYLTQVSSAQIASYIEQCLIDSFEKSGQVLQDIANELGRRLDYLVENGLYGGRSNAIGHDGLWTSPEGHSIVVEVKTTDAYRVSLDTIAGYREALIANGKINRDKSSILVIVGRQDTGELEAQVRGSRHAWDVRLISAEALIKLLFLKENSDGEETGRKIRSVLVPVEYTRVDGLVDVAFAAATDVDAVVAEPEGSKEASESVSKNEFVDENASLGRAEIAFIRNRIVEAISKKLGKPLIKKTSATLWSPDRSLRIVCTLSKNYGNGRGYWYAFHPKWKNFLEGNEDSFFVLGCSDLNRAFAVPLKTLESLLDGLNITRKDDKMYWHIVLRENTAGHICLLHPKKSLIDIESCAVYLK